MSNGYYIAKEWLNPTFNYGNTEEKIGFVMDNYYVAMDIYRAIIKAKADIEQQKIDAHNELNKLRDNEERWKRRKQYPQDFDAEEHQKRKDYLAELREAEFDIFYKGIPVKHDKLGYLVYNNLGVFGVLNKIDSGTRKAIGPIAKSVIKAILKPAMKVIRINQDHTSNMKFHDALDKSYDYLNEVPERIKDKIVNP